jgi:hypothetical protein
MSQVSGYVDWPIDGQRHELCSIRSVFDVFTYNTTASGLRDHVTQAFGLWHAQ